MSEELIRELRHLVSLNEYEHGGPYQGTAAFACILAMRRGADALAAKDAALSEMRVELDRLRKALEPFSKAAVCASETGRRPHDFVIIEDFYAARALADGVRSLSGEEKL